MAKAKDTTDNSAEPLPKAKVRRYKVDRACYIEGVYHRAGDIIILSNPALVADYMHEM